MTPQETLHSILLDAKARIKDGELYDDDGDLCLGICFFVDWHRDRNVLCKILLNKLIREHKKNTFNYAYIAEPCDFTDPKRIALLEWLIERTAP
jgi:hypothetical protein